MAPRPGRDSPSRTGGDASKGKGTTQWSDRNAHRDQAHARDLEMGVTGTKWRVVEVEVRGTRARARGKGTTSSLLTKWSIAWGRSHTPFGGMRCLAASCLLQPTAVVGPTAPHGTIILPQGHYLLVTCN
eukprot:scaffold11709_cov145-Isochrysis_galbana.AAC.6